MEAAYRSPAGPFKLPRRATFSQPSLRKSVAFTDEKHWCSGRWGYGRRREPRSRRYHLLAKGYSVCLIFLKLFERVYAPLTAARLHPVPGDAALAPRKRSLLDRLYQRLNAALDRLLHAIGLAPIPTSNENKILVHAPINAYAFSQTGLRKSGPCGAV